MFYKALDCKNLFHIDLEDEFQSLSLKPGIEEVKRCIFFVMWKIPIIMWTNWPFTQKLQNWSGIENMKWKCVVSEKECFWEITDPTSDVL